MTGNDIVDRATAAAESNWKRKGFLEKIFSLQEQQYIREAALPDEMVWKLWTMKESAYKIYTRQYGGRFFAPQKFTCTILTRSTGKVNINNISYHTTTNSAKNYIYSIARQDAMDMISLINCWFVIPKIQHTIQRRFIYEKMIANYAWVTGRAKKDMSVIKDKNGIPSLYCSNDNTAIPVSITHHGHFAAFTIN